MATKKARRTLKVVFDTNVLFTEHASELVRLQIKDLVTKNKGDSDLAIEWYLPQLVIGERRYQMRHVAYEFLPDVRKLERLLGVGLNITEQVLDVRVDEAIDRSIKELELKTLPLEYTAVNLQSLAEASVNRAPPFAENGRGFRDALIAQTFAQLIQNSPRSGNVCRLVLLTNDGLLTECVNTFLGENSNASVLADVAVLESLINTLLSTVTEEYVKRLAPKAHNLFFELDNKNTVWYRDEIWKLVGTKFETELASVPSTEHRRQNSRWQLAVPGFSKKVKQRLYWTTGIAIPFDLFKTVPKATETLNELVAKYAGTTTAATAKPFDLFGKTLATEQASNRPSAIPLRELLGSITEPVKAGTGTTRVEVEWSASVSAAERLSRPKVEDLRLVGTTFEVV